MRVFVTGASGHIGSAVVTDLLREGHEVLGLARSNAAARTIEALGATAYWGDLNQPASLRAAAAQTDAVIHLAFDVDMQFTDFQAAVAKDIAVVTALGDALAGTDKALIGVGIGPTGDAERDAALARNPRSAVGAAIAGLTERRVRSVMVAIPSVTHSDHDVHGFLPRMIAIARATGVSGYVDDGANRWPAGHTLDVAHLYSLAVTKAPAGSQLFAAAEAGVAVRDIAEAIGRRLGIPTKSIPADRVAHHFVDFPFAAMDVTMPDTSTRQLLGWEPTHPGVIADLEEEHYFRHP